MRGSLCVVRILDMRWRYTKGDFVGAISVYSKKKLSFLQFCVILNLCEDSQNPKGLQAYANLIAQRGKMQGFIV